MAKARLNILDKLRENSTIGETSILSKSKYFDDKDMIPTQVPMINVALSGKTGYSGRPGGLTPGLTVWAGQSKHFKSLFSLLMAKSYLDKYPEAALLFYDSEFGTPKDYWKSLGIDTNRVIHSPLVDIEQLKHDVASQLKGISRGDRVIIVLDSLGNLASKKEAEDALEGKSVADMTRAKQIKSFFRIVTPYLNLYDIPMVVVNHTYKSMGLFPTDVVSGGTGPYLSADNIFIVQREQVKEGNDVVGYNFTIRVEKSRYVKEKSKIPITVTFDSGISRWSGLLEIAVDGGFVKENRDGKSYAYSKPGDETQYKAKGTDSKTFWDSILKSDDFNKYIESRFMLSSNSIISEKEFDVDIAKGFSDGE